MEKISSLNKFCRNMEIIFIEKKMFQKQSNHYEKQQRFYDCDVMVNLTSFVMVKFLFISTDG